MSRQVFSKAAFDVLIKKLCGLWVNLMQNQFFVSGGVAANKTLKKNLKKPF